MRLRHLLPVMLGLAACRPGNPTSSVPAHAVRLVGPADSAAHVVPPYASNGFERPHRGVVRRQDEFRALWRQLRQPADHWGPTRAPIDFAREMVVVVGAGTFGGTGPHIWIDSVLAAHRDLIVFVRTAACDGFWHGGQMITAPVDMVRVPAGFTDVRFVETQTQIPTCVVTRTR